MATGASRLKVSTIILYEFYGATSNLISRRFHTRCQGKKSAEDFFGSFFLFALVLLVLFCFSCMMVLTHNFMPMFGPADSFMTVVTTSDWVMTKFHGTQSWETLHPPNPLLLYSFAHVLTRTPDTHWCLQQSLESCRASIDLLNVKSEPHLQKLWDDC